MKLREIVKLSSIMLNLDDVLSSSKLYDETFDITSEQTTLTGEDELDKTFNLLIRCFNLSYSEIATDYLPLINYETIEVTNKNFDLSKLSKKFFKLIKLEDKNSFDVKYTIYNNTLVAKDGEYNIIYCYLPSFASLNSDVEDFNGKIVDRVFAYGLCKEYCYISGLYDEAESFKVKFEESLKALNSNKKNIVLPKRRWQ